MNGWIYVPIEIGQTTETGARAVETKWRIVRLLAVSLHLKPAIRKAIHLRRSRR